MGSSTFGLPALKLLHQKHQVVCVYTRPAKPAGRGMQEQKTPIHEFALAHEIMVLTPSTLRTETAADELSAYKPDVVFVAAYGLILPQAILDVPKQGCINIHGSLLPRWRGAAPIHHALLNGDPEIGVTIMKMDVGLDTGGMLKKAVLSNYSAIPVGCAAGRPGPQDAPHIKKKEVSDSIDFLSSPKLPEIPDKTLAFRDDTSFLEIHDAIAQLGGELLIDVLVQLNTIIPEIQDESLATYAHKVTKKDAAITNDMPVQKVLNIIRTFGGEWGGRFTYKGEVLAIHTAITANSVIPEDRVAVCPGLQATPHTKKESPKDLIGFSSPLKWHKIPDRPMALRDDTLLTRKDDSAVLIKQDNKLIFLCTDGMIEIKSIQRSGKRIMTTKEFLNGFRL